jgi:elongation factor 2
MMDVPTNIRNMSVIAHVDHGKTTLTDNLVASAGIIAAENSGKTTYTMCRKDEIARGITIKSTAISMHFEASPDTVLPEGSKGRGFLINLIDSPGHVDFSSEVTAALRITDGAMVVVDTIEGVCVQTETVLRQAISERIKPVLVVNKADRALLELKLDAETIYQKFVQAIESANAVIGTYQNDSLGSWLVDPAAGSVAFGSGLHGWFFTINKFAKMYAAKFGINPANMMERLWGDNYYDPLSKKWAKTPAGSGGRELPRAFCHFVMDPIVRLSRAVMEGDDEVIDKVLASQNIVLKAEEKALEEKHKLKAILRKWLPATETLMEMMVTHLPSPVVAQQYRGEILYTGPRDDKYAKAIRSCDPKGSLMIYVSKMVPAAERGRFYAVGRVFSGTVRTSHKVRIMGSNYTPWERNDLYLKSVQRPVLLMGRTTELLPDCPCGNIIGLSGIDHFLMKSGTLTDQECADAYPFKAMKFSVSPVVRVAVAPKNAADLPKLVEGMKKLANSDPLCQCYTEESGEHIVAGCGELHIEICIQDLRDEFCSFDLNVSDPVVSFRETVSTPSTQVVFCKSANKHNRSFMEALPLSSGVPEGDRRLRRS